MLRHSVHRTLQHIRRLVRATSDPASDGQLLRRFHETRAETAFVPLVHRHGPLVLGVSRRILGNDHDADDVFQATFLLLIRKAAALSARQSVAGWLYRVAYHLATKARVRAARRRDHERRAAIPAASEPYEPGDVRELARLLDDALAQLPEKFRLPLLLCCLHGKSRDEAAQELGWTSGRVKAGLERGRELLRQRLGQHGVSLSAGMLAGWLTTETVMAVPPALLAVTAQAAIHGVLSASVAGYVQGGLQMMLWRKVRNLSILVLSLLAFGAGTTALWNGSRPGSEAVAAEDSSTEVARLIEQLRGNVFAARQAAAQRLVEIGEPARGALEQAAKNGDLDLQRRVEQIMSDIDDHTRAGRGETRRVREFLLRVKSAPAALGLADRYRAVSEVVQYDERELRFLIPQLLQLLADETALEVTALDQPTQHVRHRATWTLELLAARSLGAIPERGGLQKPPDNWSELDRAAAQRLREQWQAWWQAAQKKSRAQWLEEQRAQLLQRVTDVHEGARPDDSLGRAAVHLLCYGGDTRALPGLLKICQTEVARRQAGTSTLQRYEVFQQVIEALGRLGDRSVSAHLLQVVREEAQRVEASKLPVADFVRALGLLGDKSVTLELIGLARQVNRSQTPQTFDSKRQTDWGRSRLLIAFAATLNQLTDQSIEATYNFEVAKRYEHTAIREDAFDTWSEAVRAQQWK